MSIDRVATILSDHKYIAYRKLERIAEKNNVDCNKLLKKIREKSGRKIICFYGNCQSTVYEHLFLKSNKLTEKYIVFSFGPVQNIHGIEEQKGLPPPLLQAIDIFVYQDVKGTTSIPRALNTKDILKNLKSTAVAVCIPNIYFDGLFPQYVVNRYNVFYKIESRPDPRPVFPYGDKNIEKMASQHSAEEIALTISKDNFYSVEECNRKLEDSILELRRREEGVCDVTMSDYIWDNYKKEYMFYTVNHPRNFVIRECLVRVFRYLRFDETDIGVEPHELDTVQQFIYPSVYKNLDLEYILPEFYWNKDLCEKPCDMLEYVSAYFHYCGRRILMNNTNKEILPYISNQLVINEKSKITDLS